MGSGKRTCNPKRAVAGEQLPQLGRAAKHGQTQAVAADFAGIERGMKRGIFLPRAAKQGAAEWLEGAGVGAARTVVLPMREARERRVRKRELKAEAAARVDEADAALAVALGSELDDEAAFATARVRGERRGHAFQFFHRGGGERLA